MNITLVLGRKKRAFMCIWPPEYVFTIKHYKKWNYMFQGHNVISWSETPECIRSQSGHGIWFKLILTSFIRCYSYSRPIIHYEVCPAQQQHAFFITYFGRYGSHVCQSKTLPTQPLRQKCCHNSFNFPMIMQHRALHVSTVLQCQSSRGRTR